jgi:hypothetical protein
MASSSPYVIIALLLAAVFSISMTAASAEDGMTAQTSGGTLKIMLEPTWSDGGQAKFKVSFLDPKTGTVHQHQDYDVRILKDGKVIYSAAQEVGQTVEHNVAGTLTIPGNGFYTFKDQGDYTVEVYLAGTGIPATPTDEKADFNIKVTPEFPVGAVGAAMAALVGTTIVLSRKFNIGLKI